ncbi:EF-hand domain-containing protein [Amycolatopsis speibonae]|uniref:EF-hand domain-containing protein n=1 Tax=Amycolatopsis speibonae TaxID=1450224 RepID=A0ABV7NVH6_9PSEU
MLKTKHDKLFDLLDYDGNGTIERDDFEKLAADLIKAGADNPHAPSAEAVAQAYRRAFERFVAHVDTDGDGIIDRDEFHTAMATQADREARFDDIWGPTCDVEFDNVDVNGDGKLDREEFAELMAGFGQTPATASAAFDRLAADGFITRKTYYYAWKTYVSSDDDSAAANAMMA